MLAVYAAHVVQSKINHHTRKRPRRTRSGITSKLVLIGHGPTGLKSLATEKRGAVYVVTS